MTTTAVFAEILVIGLQACAWLGLLLGAFVDFGPIVAALDGWEALVTVFVIGQAYVLGVLVDRGADSLLSPFTEGGRSDAEKQAFGELRRRSLTYDTPLTAFLEYQRSRMRVARGTTFNLLIALPILNLFVWRIGAEPMAGWLAGLNVLGVLAIAASMFAYARIRAAQNRWLKGLELVNEGRSASADPPANG